MSSTIRNMGVAYRGLRNYYSERPFSISFEVTHSCNARCKHCHLRGMIKDEVRAAPERFGQLCQELGPVVAQASGGEPLLRRDLEEIVQAFRVSNRPPMVAITTNASLLSRKRYDSLRDAGVDEFSISLDYPDERHDEFRGVPRLFSKINDLINTELREVSDKGILLCCVIQSDNYRLLPDMAELARKWGIKLNFSSYTTLRTKNDAYMLSAEQVDELEHEIVPKLMRQRLEHMNVLTSPYAFENMVCYFRDREFPNCRTGTKFLNVNPDGTISPCGLIIKDYRSQKELIERFARHNTCAKCYTSVRANTEKPALRMLADNLFAARMRAKHGATVVGSGRAAHASRA